MVDVSYLNFQTLQNTYKAMKEAGKVKAAQKELAKLKDLINRMLVPELDELDKEIAIKGFDTILEKHPSLIEVMENLKKLERRLKYGERCIKEN